MFPQLALRALPLVRVGRLWIIMTGILFVACIILLHISVGIEGYASGADYWRSYWMGSSVRNPSHQQLSHTLAFPKTYVISLPRRADRRAQMGLLKDALQIDWTYMDAVEANSLAVTTILQQVYILRSQVEAQLEHGMENVQEDNIFSVFDWPRDIEAVVHSQGPLRPYGADFWILPSSEDSKSLADPLTSAHIPSAQPIATVDPPPLACASGNNVSATFSPNLPFYKHLTAAKAACWYSHLQTIRDVADGEHEAVLVLEDDVDVERDMDRRLQALLEALPRDWDIIYLGALVPKSLDNSQRLYHRSLLVRRVTVSAPAQHLSATTKWPHDIVSIASCQRAQVHTRIHAITHWRSSRCCAFASSAICVLAGNRPGVVVARTEPAFTCV